MTARIVLNLTRCGKHFARLLLKCTFFVRVCGCKTKCCDSDCNNNIIKTRQTVCQNHTAVIRAHTFHRIIDKNGKNVIIWTLSLSRVCDDVATVDTRITCRVRKYSKRLAPSTRHFSAFTDIETSGHVVLLHETPRFNNKIIMISWSYRWLVDSLLDHYFTIKFRQLVLERRQYLNKLMIKLQICDYHWSVIENILKIFWKVIKNDIK